ncbi:MAG: hypothetical protein IPM34_04345 [Saprospiraceae bacterium]|nr:hypothetical protein [Saprospiraceae bacterium]
MNAVYKNLVKFLLPFAVLACSGTENRQHGFTVENKGLTCDAVVADKDRFLICGESAIYNSSGSASDKDGFCHLRNFSNNDAGTGFSVGNAEEHDRIEKIKMPGGFYIVSGFTGADKNKFVAKLDSKFNLSWARSSDSIQTTDQAEMAINPEGHILLAGKNPSDESYEIQLHLFDPDGKTLWSRKMPSVEILQDIIVTKDQQFLVSFKQKGAYIDGQTRKRYLMNAFYKINKEGQSVWSAKFHFDDDQVHHVFFTKVLEDASGNLYFLGQIAFQANVENAYIVKTNSDGKILWSKFYVGFEDYVFKAGSIDDRGNLLVLGDGYGKKGGLVYASINSEGQVVWSRKSDAANYEQANAVLSNGKSHTLIWDKLFTMAGFEIGQNGKSCLKGNAELKATAQEFSLEMERFNGRMKEIPQHEWKEKTFDVKIFDKVEVKSLCN